MINIAGLQANVQAAIDNHPEDSSAESFAFLARVVMHLADELEATQTELVKIGSKRCEFRHLEVGRVFNLKSYRGVKIDQSTGLLPCQMYIRLVPKCRLNRARRFRRHFERLPPCPCRPCQY